jgi:methyl-accepting chemotaxis protein
MERQSSFSRGVRSGRRSSAGTAVLERPEHERPTTRTGNGQRGDGAHAAVDQELFADYAGQVAAIRKSQVVIEFGMDGTILDANDNLLRILGSTLDEIKGGNHSMFADEAYRKSYEYREFWAALNRGECQTSEYERLIGGGKEIWLQASYNPILDSTGKPFKVVNYATDVTLQKQALNAMLADAALLTQAALEGRLAMRTDASKHQGEYRKVIEGVNATLDAFIGPLNVSAEYVDRISKGDIPPKLTDNYNGDFNKIKNNLNACIDSLSGLSESNNVLQRMANNDYSQQVEGKYEGIFASVGQAVNVVHNRIAHVVSTIKRVSQGDLVDLLEYRKIGRRSQADELVPSLTAMMENLRELVEDVEMLVNAAADGKLATRADAGRHKGDYRKIVEGINKTLEIVVEPLKVTAQNASTLASSSEELTAVSQQMAGNAEETATQANVVSAASEEISKNVASVASASEEMQASIREIAKNANESARVAKNAVNVAHSTNETVKKLGESSQEIGNVIKVITSIAQQTNLLALNATIEAARAGEAGKGFAVVANEVKELAKQTAKATEDIGRKIEAIQGDTKGAVTAIEEISNIINQVNDISNSIASAVEEQTVTTNEIGHSVTEAAKGVGDIAKNIGGVALAAKNTTQGANDTQKASAELSHMAAQLQKVVSRFTF